MCGKRNRSADLARLSSASPLQSHSQCHLVAEIKQICEELVTFVGRQTILAGQSTVRQYVRALEQGSKDEQTMEQLFDQLNRAKMDISLHIQLTQIEISGNLRDGFVAALTIIERIDKRVQSVIGSRLRIAAMLEERRPSLPGL